MLQSAQTCPKLQSHASSARNFFDLSAQTCRMLQSASSILLSYRDCCTPMLPPCFIFMIF